MANSESLRNKMLGDINPNPPNPSTTQPRGMKRDSTETRPSPEQDESEQDESMTGGSKHDRSRHSGSRDVTEGVTGGVGTEVGGTRNYRQGTGATGGDIGNRPE